jgi:membrane-bound metal-dependent hydrolase YbcI (DUF457 family)
MMAIIAVVPDMDVIAFSLVIQHAHPFGHRGFSHSLIFAGAISFLSVLRSLVRRPRSPKVGGGSLPSPLWLLKLTAPFGCRN